MKFLSKKQLSTDDMNQLKDLFLKLKTIQDEFRRKFGVKDIYSNSRYFEILIANELDHNLIPGFSGTRDAKDTKGNEYEYKHYKETSSNHTWTFNDFSDTTIEKLNSVEAVVFSHINDKKKIPVFDWCYIVPGKMMSNFLKERTKKIKNLRKMINVSPKQIEENLKIRKTRINKKSNGKYEPWIHDIFETIRKIEKIIGTKDILTSNKIWEVLIALKLGHFVLTKQTKYDAIDKDGNYYEYKTSRKHSWNFEDITKNVLDKFKNVKSIILATIDKENMEVTEIYEIEPLATIKVLERKLEEKKQRYKKRGKLLRRLQVSLNLTDVRSINGKSLL